MKQYLLGLALGGDAQAEEQRDCIDRIVLDIHIEPLDHDLLSDAYAKDETKNL